jgi:hypothetical protein
VKRGAAFALVLVAAAVVGSRAVAPRPAPPVPDRSASGASPGGQEGGRAGRDPEAKDPEGPPRPWFGWQIADSPRGVCISQVTAGGPAARAGIAPGDVIVGVTGGATRPPDLPRVGGEKAGTKAVLEAIRIARPGDEIALTVRGPGGEERALRIAVGSALGLDAILARTIAGGAKALAALQGESGLWPAPEHGDTGVAASALACCALAAVESGSGSSLAPRAPLERGLAALRGRLGPDGGLDDAGEPVARRVLANAAFALALPPGEERDGVRAWLVRAQVAASDPLDRSYGGFADDPRDARSDIARTAWALEALAAAGLPPESPVLAHARRFVERSQNGLVLLDPREARFRDGGSAAAPDASLAGAEEVGESASVPRSEGLATACGVRALVALGEVPGPRVDSALAWLAREWTLERVPGFDPASPRASGLVLHHLATLARALHAAHVARIAGRDWSDELARALARRQDPASNTFATPGGLEGEDAPAVGTSLALLALAAARDERALLGDRAVEAGPPVLAPQILPSETTSPSPSRSDPQRSK